MYRLINNNINLLLDGISKETHIDPYISICKSYKNQKSNTPEFKKTYRSFYQLNAARLSDDFCESYFSLLEESRDNDTVNVEDITNRLYDLESNSKGTHAVQFSFASKLVHTVNDDFPIYDSMVSAFYFFPDVKPNWDKKRKIQEYLESYQFLRNEYCRIMENNLLEVAMEEFRERFAVGDEYSNMKLIDTLLWRFTALLKSGAIRNGDIPYD